MKAPEVGTAGRFWRTNEGAASVLYRTSSATRKPITVNRGGDGHTKQHEQTVAGDAEAIKPAEFEDPSQGVALGYRG